MADHTGQDLTAEEREQLERAERDGAALAALIEDLGSSSRRRRQFAARVVALLAQRDVELLAPHVEELIDALYRPEAQTRWEVLDALTLLVPTRVEEIDGAFEGAEAALFDELSATLRLSAFTLLTTWGASDEERSQKAWPLIDEAVQCYHGDIEYRDMLAALSAFADGAIAADVASELAGRLQFDAQNGKDAYLKARSSEIYDLLVTRFKLTDPKRRARLVSTTTDDDE